MLKIDTEACIGCGVCEDNCAFGAIKVEDGCAVVGDNCTLCGTCVDLCEAGALSIERDESGSGVDLSEWSGIWVYAEFRHGRLAPVALELLGAGRRLADDRGVPLTAVLMGSGLDGVADTLIAHGADRVLVVDRPELAEFTDDVYAKVLEELIRKEKPEVVLAGATAIGRSFIPRVANSLTAGLTADCTGLEVRKEDGALLQTRPAFGGNIMATIVCPNHRPQMATVRPLVMRPLPEDPSRRGEIVAVDPDPASLESRVKVRKSVREESADMANLQEVDVIVAGGRGMGGEKGFAMLNELAGLLGGGVAASRAAVDSGWIGYAHQVGQTGRTVSPKLYIACGISGAIQHVIGMQASDTVIAINRDGNAPIFDIATYGVVGDVFEVLPKVIERLRQG